eukprot:355127-Chlamydomonas_euryale.AAC.23
MNSKDLQLHSKIIEAASDERHFWAIAWEARSGRHAAQPKPHLAVSSTCGLSRHGDASMQQLRAPPCGCLRCGRGPGVDSSHVPPRPRIEVGLFTAGLATLLSRTLLHDGPRQQRMPQTHTHTCRQIRMHVHADSELHACMHACAAHPHLCMHTLRFSGRVNSRTTTTPIGLTLTWLPYR